MLLGFLGLFANVKNIVILFLTSIFLFTLFSYLSVGSNSKYVYDISDPTVSTLADSIEVGIVFGGGVGDQEPLPLTKERLDTAIKLYEQGYIKKLIVSGDNRFLNYNEPNIMQSYLVAQGIPRSAIQPDYAGRSTYETCERASKIFDIKKAFLISESTHLARAVYLCRNFNVESYGIQSDGLIAAAFRIPQQLREIVARDKAVFNIYILGERTVLGQKIDLNLQLR